MDVFCLQEDDADIAGFILVLLPTSIPRQITRLCRLDRRHSTSDSSV